MADLLADRFLPCGAAWIDLASGATVRINLTPERSRGDTLVWSDWCATLALLRHPLLNVLVDYGHAGAGRTFEAYSVSAPLQARGAAGARLLAHVVRFLERQGVHVPPPVAGLALRQVEAAPVRVSQRPLGIVLQPRQALRALEDALIDAAPGGVSVLAIAGERGSGLRTAYTQAARIARTHGYVPVSAALLAAAPWIAGQLRARHLCLMLEAGPPRSAGAAARLASRLGVESARRHVAIRFDRERSRNAASLVLEPLGVTAMMSMVFKDRDDGPGDLELMAAARIARGWPGRFLASLRAHGFPEQRPTSGIVHETAPAYVIDPDRAAPAPLPRGRAPARSILSAEERAARIAARGRHASAVRLLARATRVLEARGEPALAASCAERLGWILRDRGQTPAALESFARAAALGRDGPLETRAAIATGVTWTDECRFAEAEAALRGAIAAADLRGDTAAGCRARIALARSLYWQERYDEAAVTLHPALESPPAYEVRVQALALAARIRVAKGELPSALACASEALAAAARLPPRTLAAAARAMALTQAALGDARAADGYVRQGLAAAAAAHAPLVALRLRAVRRTLPGESEGAGASRPDVLRALGGASVPPLIRLQLQRTQALLRGAVPNDRALPPSALQLLQRLLELAHNAPDDAGGVHEVCREVGEKLRAATVQVLSADADRRLLGCAGRPWTGDLSLVERALACPGEPVTSADAPFQTACAVSYGSEPIAALACRWTLGAAIEPDRASALVRTAALALAPTVRTLLDRAAAASAEPAWRELIGSSPPALALRDAIARAARAPFPVLIEGESGSGKELVARAVHRLSARRDRKLCTVNCAAISDDLLEAELFGHTRGAFTGAIGERAGLFEEADGGTLFLDEVGELSPRAQAKLLRVLQDGEVRRIGENFARRVDARVVAATNRRLDDEVGAGRFRADLRFRLDVVRISVPPLRDRAVDIPLLAAHFWEEAARRVGSRAALAPDTVLALARYDWPGNVRQLQNVIASLAVHAPRRGRVPPSLLPAHVARTAAAAATFEAARLEFERRFVAAELARAGGQRARAARALGVTRQGLAKMIRRLGID